MWFLVVYKDGLGNLTSKKVNTTTMYSTFDFGNYVNAVIEFTRSAGIGDYTHVGNCLIIRTR